MQANKIVGKGTTESATTRLSQSQNPSLCYKRRPGWLSGCPREIERTNAMGREKISRMLYNCLETKLSTLGGLDPSLAWVLKWFVWQLS